MVPRSKTGRPPVPRSPRPASRGQIPTPGRAPAPAAAGVAAAASAAAGEAPPAVRRLVVDASGEGQRLDNFLLALARGVPKSHVYRIVRSGEVRVNGGRASVQTRLALGDEVRVPPLRTSAAAPPAPASLPPVLYEDEHLLVLDKPAGIAAHGGSGVAHGLIERARAARPHEPMLELAHRLDRETSGVLLLAKTRRALVALHAMQREGAIGKRYLALVKGDWVNDRQHVRLSLSRREGAVGGERRVVVDEEDGQSAHTIFSLRERFGEYSLLEAELRSGRTHQIRVHLAHLGFPIVGDDRYGDFETNRRFARGAMGPRLERMFLHAWRMRLVHPVGGATLDFEAALPADCTAVVASLRSAAPLSLRKRGGG